VSRAPDRGDRPGWTDRPSDRPGAGAAFAALGLSPPLVRAALDQGYAFPTPVQSAAIPPALLGRDLIGIAPTGTGKTGAFGLALLERLAQMHRPAWRRTHALVLVPTRELALQVGEVLRALSQGVRYGLKVASLFGGVSVNPQMMALRGGAEVIVATPGRLLDLVERNAVKLEDVEILVLDEADRLLDEGFADDLARIRALLPARRQGFFFSATFAPEVQALAAAWLQAPLRLDLGVAPGEGAGRAVGALGGQPGDAPGGRAPGQAGQDADGADGGDGGDAGAMPGSAPAIVQRAIAVDAARRTALLRHLIAQGGWPRVLVFVATRYASEHVAEKLRRAGLSAAAFHGDLSQGARTRVLAEFNGGAVQVLLATDMAARGLHIPGLPVVLNYDLPRSATDYTHRIGRTARAGAEGQALSFITAATEAHFRLIEKRQAQRLPREQIAGFEPTELPPASPADPDQTGGIKGRRKSKKDKLREAAGRG